MVELHFYTVTMAFDGIYTELWFCSTRWVDESVWRQIVTEAFTQSVTKHEDWKFVEDVKLGMLTHRDTFVEHLYSEGFQKMQVEFGCHISGDDPLREAVFDQMKAKRGIDRGK